jgi:hypothetical protein
MTSLNLSESSECISEKWQKKGTDFWSRQFQTEATYKQKRFDIIFGVVLPVMCFFFDPVVFKWWLPGGNGALLGTYKPFAYILSYAAIMGLLGFLLMGKKLKWANAF